jgi:hypothetical protein
MVDCDYCEESVDCADRHDQEFLTHLAEEHFDELGAVDQRLVENVWEGNIAKLQEEEALKPAIVAGIFAGGFAIVIGVFAVQMLGLGAAESPTGNATGDWVYEQGTMEITVDGEQLSSTEMTEGDSFYVAEDGETWHMNVPTEDRLRIAEGLEELGVISVDGGSISVAEQFVQGSETDVSVTVNGVPAELGDEVQNGDQIEFVVESVE